MHTVPFLCSFCKRSNRTLLRIPGPGTAGRAVPFIVGALALCCLFLMRERFRVPAAGAGDRQYEQERAIERTLDALRQVESSGGRDGRDGDGGRAIGDYQIHAAYWRDAMRFLREDWPYADARNRVKARAAVRAYVVGYQQRGRYPATPETWARIHNGGPSGPRRASTLDYWRKVRTILAR